MKKSYRSILLSLVSLMLFPSLSFALNPDTHKYINKFIAANSMNKFSLDTYLSSQLDFKNGIKEEFTADETKQVWEWLRDGGEYEDVPAWYLPYLRSVNHFNNPLGFPNNPYGFTTEGLSGISLTEFINFFTLTITGYPVLPSSTWIMLPPNNQYLGYYSWNDVRGYYLNALTSATQDDRNTNFVETFRGLGQLMHLVQDASVPAHARNDAHIAYNYETWVSNNVNNDTMFANYAANTTFFKNIANVSSFIDTDQYNGTNPGVAVGDMIGLSEYSNANFFSEHTINKSFPYPDINQSAVTTRDITHTSLFGLSTSTYPRWYYVKSCCGEVNGPYGANQGYLLSTIDFLHDYRIKYLPINQNQPPVPTLDDYVYADYAYMLLPRAIGYSAGLLKYFFRGQIEMTPDSSGQYQIVNKSNETMHGTFSLYYDATDGNRNSVSGVDFSSVNDTDLKPGEENAKSISSFQEPSDIKESGKYILVFNGKLGNEAHAIVGRVVTLKGYWEGWNSGTYTALPFDNMGNHFSLQTDRHDWHGSYWWNPPPNIKVEDGLLKVDATVDSSKSWAWAGGVMYVLLDDSGSDRTIPLGCPTGQHRYLKVNVPYANFSQPYSSCEPWYSNYDCNNSEFGILITLTDGIKYYSLAYNFAEGSALFNWSFADAGPSVWRIFLGTGDKERDIATDFTNQVAARLSVPWWPWWPLRDDNYVGDINKWRINRVDIYFEASSTKNYTATSEGLPNSLSAAIDYIDFVCK